MSFKDYKKHFPKLKLKHTTVKLKTYTGERITPLGKLNVKVKYKNQRCNLELYVLKYGVVPLFGRQWLRHIRLNWDEVKAVQIATKEKSQCAGEQLTQILDKHAQVFKEGIGKLKHIKAPIELEDNAKPRFHKARPVPYALCPKVEAELQNLVDQGILTKVDWSECATPIAPAGKKTTDKVRICRDFKVTLNPVIHADQYPLSHMDGIFASLAHGECFTKTDLAQACLQMEMEES